MYIQPLVEELQELWKEVNTFDVTRPRGKFLLRAICMWSLHDYPTYGLFVSCHLPKATWHAQYAGQRWILDIPHKKKKPCILDIGVTLLKATHT